MQQERAKLPGSHRNAAVGAKVVGKTDPGAIAAVTIVLSRQAPVQGADLLSHVSRLPGEREDVGHAEFADRHGASDEAVAAAAAFAKDYGLSVTDVDKARRVVHVSGAVSDLERAFGTSLDDYSVGGKRFRGRRGPLFLPVAFLPHVEAVLGLDNRPVAAPRIAPRVATNPFYPNQLATLYDFPQGDGAGQVIALIELGGNYGQQDLQAYFAAAGLANVPQLRTVSVTPGVPVPYMQEPNNDVEVMLDIEVAGAMAPGSTIVVYFAENTDRGFYEAVSQALHDPATTAVSISWGSAEKHWTQQTMDAWASLGEAAAMLNVPVFVASGDHGCADETSGDDGYDGLQHVDFPASCPIGFIACGGTNLRAAAASIDSETVWNDGQGWASGGGTSTHFLVPTWQSGCMAETGVPLAMRGVPDVAGHADSATGIHVRYDGNDDVRGGTSAVAPQWAALAAIISQKLGRRLGFFLPPMYAKAGVTNDVVAGNNSTPGVVGYEAKAGWDACTGLGSPRGTALLALLSGTTQTAVAGQAGAVPLSTADLAHGGAAARGAVAFDPAAAFALGRFVSAAYDMRTTTGVPDPLRPPPTIDFPQGWRLSAWVQMEDFIIGSTGPDFYGFVAQSETDANNFVLALRGTLSLEEWWDDANALVKTPFKVQGCGAAAAGFCRIYDTLNLVEASVPGGAAVAAAAPAAGGFAAQMSALLSHHAFAGARTAGVPLPATASITIVGHSLGGALATLYAMENAKQGLLRNPGLLTFGSPRVGDTTFVSVFDQLGLASWRVVNAPDVVPNLPPAFMGFAHVGAEQSYDSTAETQWSPGCWHAMDTYLHLLEPSHPLATTCARQAAPGPGQAAARASAKPRAVAVRTAAARNADTPRGAPKRSSGRGP